MTEPDRKTCAIAAKGPRYPVCSVLCPFCADRLDLDVDSPVGYTEQTTSKGST